MSSFKIKIENLRVDTTSTRAHQDINDLSTRVSKMNFHDMTREEVIEADKRVRAAKKARIESALAELQRHAEETMSMIDRELNNSNTSSPSSVGRAVKAIKKIDLSAAWAHHEEEMEKSKSQRDKDHRDRILKARAASLAEAETRSRNSPSACQSAKVSKPILFLTVDQTAILQKYCKDNDCIPTSLCVLAKRRLPTRRPAPTETPALTRE